MAELARHLRREIDAEAQEEVVFLMIASAEGEMEIISRKSADDLARLFVNLAYIYTFEEPEVAERIPLADQIALPDPVAARDSVVLSVD